MQGTKVVANNVDENSNAKKSLQSTKVPDKPKVNTDAKKADAGVKPNFSLLAYTMYFDTINCSENVAETLFTGKLYFILFFLPLNRLQKILLSCEGILIHGMELFQNLDRIGALMWWKKTFYSCCMATVFKKIKPSFVNFG